jgi:hypothetical protein
MNATVGRRGIASETMRRRWRLAVLFGLVVLLTLAAFAIVQVEQNAQANRMVAVLKAEREILAGTTITVGELGVSQLRTDDAAVLDHLVDARDRERLVGQVATQTVPAYGLIPAGLGVPQASARRWEVPLPVKRMPADLRPGDHVALVVNGTARSGQPVDFVAIQDVSVLEVHPDSVTLWLPATAAAQMQWYADHAVGIVVIRMPPGATQQDVPTGGAG